MQEIVFYPKYRIRHSLDVLSIGLLLILALSYSLLRVGLSLPNLVGVGFLLFFIFQFSPLYIRRIVFAPSYFLVDRYVWPSMKIDYSDVIDLGTSKVKTRRGEISFAAMSNVIELQSVFFELMRQGKIDIEQFENKALHEEVALRKSFLPIVIISTVLGGVFLLYWFYHQSEFTLVVIWLLLGLLVIVITSIVYWINKKRTKIQ